MTLISKPILASVLAFALLGVTGAALAAPMFHDDEYLAPPSAIDVAAVDDADRLAQRAAITPSELLQRAADFGAVNAFLVFASAGKRLGVLESRYAGEFFRPDLEERRQCIVLRESNGRYDAVSPGGTYRGAYQMSEALGIGVTWMMLPEHKTLLGADVAKTVLSELRETPVDQWPRYWQDAAFSTIHNWESDGSGASHWRGGRWSC